MCIIINNRNPYNMNVIIEKKIQMCISGEGVGLTWYEEDSLRDK